uniref:Cyclase family protein n=1 Tax=Leersia perrieri TaxID=77586 RepID=A0A0D9X6K4_9ORYZ
MAALHLPPRVSPPLLILLTLVLRGAAATPSAHPAYPDDGPASCAAAAEPERREVHGGGMILDISHYYREDMPSWESEGGVGQFLWLPHSMRNGSLANNSEMRLPTHTGTHVDAPGHVFQHYFDAGFDVDSLDLHVLNGRYYVNCRWSGYRELMEFLKDFKNAWNYKLLEYNIQLSHFSPAILEKLIADSHQISPIKIGDSNQATTI